MTYKVFLVEDEVTTREGIRDNVDWRAMGFVLCGEAPDGEIALPQIEAIQTVIVRSLNKEQLGKEQLNESTT